MIGDGLSFEVSETVSGEFHSAMDWAEANRRGGTPREDHHVYRDDDDSGSVATDSVASSRYRSPSSSMV